VLYNPTSLSRTISDWVSAYNPVWGPYGEWIIYQSLGINIINLNGNGKRQITTGSEVNRYIDGYPAWKPK